MVSSDLTLRENSNLLGLGKISLGPYYIQKKKTKNIKADGKSNLLSLANWLES